MDGRNDTDKLFRLRPLHRKKLDDMDYCRFERAASAFEADRSQTLRDVYEEMIKIYYCIEWPDGIFEVLEADQVPSPEQFADWWEKQNIGGCRDSKEILSYDWPGPEKTDLTGSFSMGPNALCQMEILTTEKPIVATPDSAGRPVKPTLYFVTDTFSRLITGVHVSTGKPSWKGAALAIANTAADKPTFTEQYGIRIPHADWPSDHLPGALLADRSAVMRSRESDALPGSLGVPLSNGDMLIRTELENLLTDWFGADDPDDDLPDDFIPMDLQTFMYLIILSILDRNNRPNRYLAAKEGPNTPAAMWDFGLENGLCALRHISEDRVIAALLPEEPVSV